MPPHAHAVEEVVDRLARRFADTRGALLPLLHALQEEIGHVPDDAIALIAERLNLSRAEVHGVVTFYHDFRREPAGRHIVKLCRAEACQARGSDAIEAAMADRFGVGIGKTRADGRLSFEAVYCLGLCAVGPNALVDGRPIARVDAAAIERLAGEIAA